MRFLGFCVVPFLGYCVESLEWVSESNNCCWIIHHQLLSYPPCQFFLEPPPLC
jgi:hypothetical protein